MRRLRARTRKIFHFGRLAVNTQLAAYYNVNVIRPYNVANWRIRFQVQLMLPK